MLTPVTKNEGEWDAFVLRHGGNFLQSWAWGEFQQAIDRRTYRFRVEAARVTGVAPETVGQFTMVDLPLPLGRRYLYVPRGPVANVSDPATAKANLDSTVEALREHLRFAGATFAKVEFPWPVTDSVVPVERMNAWGFTAAGHVQPQHTVINDLTRSEEELLAAMHQKTRYNIKVAQKHGVTVREALTDAHTRQHDLDLFWQMLDETAARDKFHTHTRDYYGKMLDVLSPDKNAGLKVRLYFAEFGGRAIASAMTCEFGDTVTYLHGASMDAERRVMAPYALHWGIMLMAKEAGFKKYDFWGVAPEGEESHSWAGITRFKVGFGGARVSYLGAWELPGNGFWYRVYRIAKRLRR